MKLAEIQRLFWELIAAPEGAAAGARSLVADGRLDSEDLGVWVKGDGRLGAVERVDVYANMYFYRLHDCLREDYPAVAGRLGAARFHDLVTDFLLSYPSRHHSLRELGRPFPGFAKEHAFAREFPEIADLARLEWARVDVFDARDATPLARDEIVARASHDPERFRVRAIPALRRLRVMPGVLPLWRAHAESSDEAPEVGEAGSAVGVRVWRRDFSVWHRSVEEDESACLPRLEGEGATVSDLAETLLAHHEEEAAMARLAALLGSWAADGIVRV